jgi:nucleoid DNA-binding protein
VEKICQHIEKLLAQHDYVVIPNLGGFVVQKESAIILSDHITPPLSTIGFNPLMQLSDGLLAIEVARSEAISYRMAMEYVDVEVMKIKTILKESGKVQLGNLGVFQRNVEGNILFIPFKKAEYLPANFGLTDIYVTERQDTNTKEKRKISFTLPSILFYKYAAACMLVFALLFATPKLNDARKVDSADLSSLVLVNQPKTSLKSNNIITETKVSALSPSDTIDAVNSKNYHVIVATLGSRKSADNYCKILRAEKFSEVHVLYPAKTYRVAIQSFSDRGKAILYMENLRKTDKQFETAWVFCN